MLDIEGGIVSLTLAQGEGAPPPAAPTNGGPPPAGPTPTGTPGTPDGTTQPAQPGAQGQQPAPGFGEFLPMIVIMVVIMWVLLILPQRREKKKRAAMMTELKKGVKVQTVGGILGTVTQVKDHEVVIKVDENSNSTLRFTRGAIHSVLPDGKPVEDKK